MSIAFLSSDSSVGACTATLSLGMVDRNKVLVTLSYNNMCFQTETKSKHFHA